MTPRVESRRSPADLAQMMTGRDQFSCPTRGRIDGDRLIVQHDDDPESAWSIPLSETSSAGEVILRFYAWCRSIHDIELDAIPHQAGGGVAESEE